jgi:hypothetical protein
MQPKTTVRIFLGGGPRPVGGMLVKSETRVFSLQSCILKRYERCPTKGVSGGDHHGDDRASLESEVQSQASDEYWSIVTCYQTLPRIQVCNLSTKFSSPQSVRCSCVRVAYFKIRKNSFAGPKEHVLSIPPSMKTKRVPADDLRLQRFVCSRVDL